MKKLWMILPLGIFAFAALMPAIETNDKVAIATDVYIYGYPLVTMDMTRKVMTNVETPSETKAPMGQFVHARTYPDPSFTDVTAPNADTLYSIAWLNLSKEPYVLHVPNEEGRYYLMPLLSGWTNVIASPGTRTTGTSAKDFAITGPLWKGKLPEGLKEIKSPTEMVWVLGRTYCTGTSEDYKAVHAIQDQYSLKPLSAFGRPYTPPKGKVDPNLAMKTPVRKQVNNLDGKAYFTAFASLLKENPPTAEDAPMVEKMEQIGIVPGQDLDFEKLPAETCEALEKAPKLGALKIKSQLEHSGKVENQWIVTAKTGNYGTDYLQRALVTAVGLGANLPEDAIYPMTDVDAEDQPLSGENHYILHFPKGKLPPVKGFWSLTLYNDKFFFVNNRFNRYALSPRDDLKMNADGSLDLYIQKDSPGSDKESNWLPAPEGKFILMMRLYWPEASILNGDWQPPAVQKTEK